MKRILAALMTAVMVMTMVPASAFADTSEVITVGTKDELITAISTADSGDTIQLTADIDLGSTQIDLDDKSLTIDGGDFTIKGSAKKTFEIANSNDTNMDVTFQNINLVNESKVTDGRCIDTRNDYITLNLTNVDMNTTGAAGNTQPLTLGGDDQNGVTVNIKDSNINALDSGYGIITFVKADVKIENSKIVGYAALYVKEGSDNSTFEVTNSILEGCNKHSGVSNTFSTISVEGASNTTFAIKDSEILSKATGDQSQFTFYITGTVTGTEANLTEGTTVTVENANGEDALVYAENTVTGTDIEFAMGTTVTGATVEEEYLAEGTKVDAETGKLICTMHNYADGTCSVCGTSQTKTVGTADELTAAVEKATGGEIIELTADIDLDDIMIQINDKSLTIDGKGFTVKSKAKKVFEINNATDNKIALTFKNITIENKYTSAGGRCIDTRNDNIDLTLDGVNLDGRGAIANAQPLTLGGNEYEGINVVIKNSTINALDSGYAIISFIKANVTIENTTLIGYTTIYCKVGSDNSVINVSDSRLEGINKYSGATNAFSTIVIEDAKNVEINFTNTEILSKSTGDQPQFVIGLTGTAENSDVTFGEGTVVTVESAQADKALVNKETDSDNGIVFANGSSVEGVKVSDEYLPDDVVISNGKVVCAVHSYADGACTVCGETDYNYEIEQLEKENAEIKAEMAAMSNALLMTQTKVSGLTIGVSGKTVTVSWTAVEGADSYNYVLKRNGKTYKSGTTTKTSLKWTNATRGVKYTVYVTPAVTYKDVVFKGISTSKSATSSLPKASFTVKKSGVYQKFTAADNNCTGYQVYISKDSKFKKNVKNVKLTVNEGKLSKSLKTKTYFKTGKNYVKVRAYTTVNGTTKYGAWSTVKTVRR